MYETARVDYKYLNVFIRLYFLNFLRLVIADVIALKSN